MKRMYYLLLMLLLFTSCNQLHQNSLKNFDSEILLMQGMALKNDSIFWSGHIVGFMEDKIITRCNNCDLVFNVYTIKKDSVCFEGAFGARGQGPNELFYPKCYLDKENRTLHIFDINSSLVKAYQIDLSVQANLYDIETWKKIDFPQKEAAFWSHFAPLSDDVYIGLGGGDTMNLLSGVFLGEDNIQDLNICYPEDNNTSSDDGVKRMEYNKGDILKKTIGNKFLYSTRMGRYAEIITMDDDAKVTDRKIISGDYPIYETSADGLNPVHELQSYMGLKSYVTNERIYIMPEPYTREQYVNNKEYKGCPNNFADRLYVFDWEGQHIRTYDLDKPVSVFAVDENDSYLLATTVNTDNGEFYIERFDIKE